jgi:hypothetical protein
MTPADFEFLINLIGPKIAKNNTTYRAAVQFKRVWQLHCGRWLWEIRKPAYNTFSKFRDKLSGRLLQKPTAFANSSQA